MIHSSHFIEKKGKQLPSQALRVKDFSKVAVLSLIKIQWRVLCWNCEIVLISISYWTLLMICTVNIGSVIMAWCSLADSHYPNRSPEQCLQTQSYVIIRLKLVNFTTSLLAQTVNGTVCRVHYVQQATARPCLDARLHNVQQAYAWPDTWVRNVQQAIVCPDTRVHNGEQATAWPDTRVHDGQQPTAWPVPGYIASSIFLTSFSPRERTIRECIQTFQSWIFLLDTHMGHYLKRVKVALHFSEKKYRNGRFFSLLESINIR